MYTKDFELSNHYKYPLNRLHRTNFNNKCKSKLFIKNSDNNIHIKHKNKVGTKWRRMLNDYSQNTTLHGLRYAGNNELSVSERYSF